MICSAVTRGCPSEEKGLLRIPDKELQPTVPCCSSLFLLDMSLNCAMKPLHCYTGNLLAYKIIFYVLALFEGEKTDLGTFLMYLREVS